MDTKYYYRRADMPPHLSAIEATRSASQGSVLEVWHVSKLNRLRNSGT